jgi:hypothetical protein
VAIGARFTRTFEEPALRSRLFRSVVCARRAVERFASLSGRVVLDHLAGNLVPAAAEDEHDESAEDRRAPAFGRRAVDFGG